MKMYKTRSCHDCVFLTIACDDPKKDPNSGYICGHYEWKYQ